jgi:hypothetical protein
VPSKRIVALMMPRVMELADGSVLNVVDAIEYVQQAQKERGEAIRLLDLLKVLQECAIALARVCCYWTAFSFSPVLMNVRTSRLGLVTAVSTPSWTVENRSCPAIAANIALAMQCIPLLRHMYPEHWLFSQHPTLRDLSDGELAGGAHLEQWEELQWDVYCSVQEHIDCFQGHHTHSLPPYVPPDSLRKRAKDLYACWVTDSSLKDIERNPLRSLALRAVGPSTESVQV